LGNVPVQVVADYDAMSAEAARLVSEAIAAKPDLVLALPTGSTPLGMFTKLLEARAAGAVDLSRVTFFCLDEYLGSAAEDANSLTGWLLKEFMEPAGIRPDQLHLVPSTAPDPDAAAADYDAALARHGGLDLVVLGLGPNGHIAFNEPGSERDSRTRVLDLSPESIAQSSAYWEPGTEVKTRAMTMGVGTLLEADRIVLIVSGPAKAGILRQALEDEPSAHVPASWLQTVAEKTLVIADEAAAAELRRDRDAR
jgi:glucosamine-6-phosphate deaminase